MVCHDYSSGEGYAKVEMESLSESYLLFLVVPIRSKRLDDLECIAPATPSKHDECNVSVEVTLFGLLNATKLSQKSEIPNC